VDWKIAFKDDICYLVDLFKTRKAKKGTEEVTLPDYPAEIKDKAEYKKVEKYFEEIRNSAQCGVLNA